MTSTTTIYRGREGMWNWVAHRAAGVAVFFFLVVHVIDTALVRVSPEAYNQVIGTYKTPIFGLVEAGLVAAIVFHAFNGLRIIAVDVTPKNPGHGLLVLLNPEMVHAEGRVTGREGCLSIPEYTANVERYERIVVRALTREGEEKVFESSGFEAICLQHELDHLDGILFLDRVTCLKTHVFRRKGTKPRMTPEELVK